MSRSTSVLAALLAACTPGTPPPGPPSDPGTGSSAELAELHRRHRESALSSRRFSHAELWDALAPRVEASPQLRREEIGRSAEGRPLFAVHYGRGPTRVLLWSQMHGDESTATMALADLVRFLADDPGHPLARRLAEELTVVMIPMLNPDGAERFQRHNAYGVDVNRDARALATPEARALREVQRSLRPHFGFNLHDQNVRTRVGSSSRLAAIALLAPPADASRRDDPVRARAKRVAAVVRQAAEPLVPGHISRYDDSFNPRAFGDLMQSWGTSTVLIESGGWRDDPEKQHLRAVNFVAILSALDAIATGAYAAADPIAYESLPENGSAVRDVLIRGGQLVVGGLPPLRVDLSIDFADPLARTGGRITEVGDLAEVEARDTVDAEGLFLHADDAARLVGGGPILEPGAPASLVARRAPDPAADPVWVMVDGRLEGREH